MESERPVWFAEAMNGLLNEVELPPSTIAEAVRDLIAGRVDDAHAASFLTALRMKGETAGEIAGAATALREQMIRLEPKSRPVLDTCGTGGDDSGTFNISTASALVVAAAGLAVVKHGNRAVSSRSGSADAFRELGLAIDAGVEWSQRCLDELGFAFCFAPHFHSGMANVAKLRRNLGIRTVFNLLGPLANPASAEFQLLGVGKPELLDPLAGAIAKLGTTRSVLVSGYDGLDEVTLATATRVRIVEGTTIQEREWHPRDFGFSIESLDAIRAEDPTASVALIRSVFANEDGPARRIVLVNAAAALWTANKVATLKDGVALAESAIASGAVRNLLERLSQMR